MRTIAIRSIPLVLVAAAVPALSAQSRVTLKVDPSFVYVNEPLTVAIEVWDFKDVKEPAFPDIPGCQVDYLGITSKHSSTSLINGRLRQTRSLTFAYELTPADTGELVIPSVAVYVDGKTLQTRARRLRVRSSDADELVALEIGCPQDHVYVGQRVPLTLALWIKPAVAYNQTLSIRSMFSVVDLTRSKLGPFPPRPEFSGARRKWRTIEGERQEYYVYELNTDWIADRPGPLSFDDVRITVNYPVAFGRDFFDRLIVRDQRTLRARPKVAAVEVLPLPAEERPPGFTGAVGVFQITAAAQPLSVRVGDPIELTIDIGGAGPIETLPPPSLVANRALTDSFHVPSESLAGMMVRGRRRFTQTIRARRAGVSEIPPIEYAYFDPHSAQYVIARSAPIPLTVSGAEALDAADLTHVELPQPGSEGPSGDEFEGLLGNETSEQVLLASVPPVRLSHLIIATAGPPVLLAAWGCLALLRGRNGESARRRRGPALANARKRIRHSGSLPPRDCAREVSAALAGYLAERLNEPPARFAGRAGAELLKSRGASSETVLGWEDIVERCERLSFGVSSGADKESIVDSASTCLTRADRERL